HRFEEIGVRADVFRGTQEQETVCLEGVMENREDPLLQRVIEVDEHVATADQIEVAEGGVGGHVMPREDAQIAHYLVDLVMPIASEEEPPQALRRNVDLDVVHVDAAAGLLQGGFIEIGGQDLDGKAGRLVLQVLQQADRQR